MADADGAISEVLLPAGARGSRRRGDYADDVAVLPLLLPVRSISFISSSILILLFPQRIQDRRTLRCDDIPNGDGRSAAVRLHLHGVRDGLLAGLLHHLPHVRQLGRRRSRAGTESDFVADGKFHFDVSDVVGQLRRLLRRDGVHGA